VLSLANATVRRGENAGHQAGVGAPLPLAAFPERNAWRRRGERNGGPFRADRTLAKSGGTGQLVTGSTLTDDEAGGASGSQIDAVPMLWLPRHAGEPGFVPEGR